MTKANECTCPSGDGSLRHPCPAHPASVELAGVAANLTFINGRPAMCGCQVEYSSGGGEYSDVIYVTLCAKHSGSAILDLVATNRIALTPEYEGQWHADLYLDREIPLAKAEGATPAEAVLALMSAERIEPEQGGVDQAGGDRWDALQSIMEWTAAENIPDDRKLCLIRNAARAALAQPSPAAVQLSGSRERRIYVAGPMTGYKDFNFPAFNAQAEELRGLGYHVENPAEHGIVDGAEWQDYLRYDIGRLSTCEAIFLLPGWSTSKGAALEVHIAKALGMTFIHHADAEHEQPSPALELERPEVVARVVHSNPVVLDHCAPLNANDELMTVAQHAASVARWAEMFNRVEQERDAALARVTSLESKLAELERQEPSGWLAHYFGGKRNGRIYGGPCNTKEEIDRYIQQVERSDDSITLQGKPFYAAPVAQPEETPGEILAAKLIETWVAKHGKPAPWSKIVEITALATNMPNDERDRLLALDDDVDAQAQHSVPEGWKLVPMDPTSQMTFVGQSLRYDSVNSIGEIYRQMLAAAPGKEGV